MLLDTPRGRINAPAFLAGGLAGILIVGAITVLVVGNSVEPTTSEGSSRAAAVDFAIAAIFLAIAAQQFRKRPKRGDDPELPGWIEKVDSFNATRAAAMGFALAALNPKNLLLIIGGAVAIAQSYSAAGDKFAALLLFAAIATLGPAAPVAIYFAMGKKADAILARMKNWLARNSATVLAVICLLIAAKLIIDGIAALPS